MIPQVDEFLAKAKQWQAEMTLLRRIVLDCGLTEELKWYQPCYTYKGNNVLIISGFKEYCALNLFKGALLKDTHGILVRPTENVQAGRQIRFTDVKEIARLEPVLKAYLFEAVEVEKNGLKVPARKTEEFPVPEELTEKFRELPDFQRAFEALTPGRQRGYLLHFAQPSQSKTRMSRIEKYLPKILDGKGLND